MKHIFSNIKYFTVVLNAIMFAFYPLESAGTQIHPEPPKIIRAYLQYRPLNGGLLSIGYLFRASQGRSFSSVQPLSKEHPLFGITHALHNSQRINGTSIIDFSCPNTIDIHTLFDANLRCNTNDRILEAAQSQFYNHFLREHRSFLIKKGFIPASNCFFTLFSICS